MTSLPQVLEQLARQLTAARGDGGAASGGAGLGVAGSGGAGLVAALGGVGVLQRLLDAVTVEIVDEIVTGDAVRDRSDRVTTRAGCRDATELLQRTLRIDRATARRYVVAADAVHEDVSLVSGEPLPGDFPELSAALRAGEVSLGGFLACVTPLQKAQSRIGLDDLAVADEVLAQAATGSAVDETETDADAAGDPGDDGNPGGCGPCPTVEELAGLVSHVLLRIDPDGAVPDDRAGERNRTFTIGRLRNGAVPVRGELLPEAAAALQRLMDAYCNPRVRFMPSADRDALFDDGDAPADEGAPADADTLAPDSDGEVPLESAADVRTPAQKRHDAFAAIITSVAAAEAAPQLGGAAPTLIVTVDAGDFATGTGRARLGGIDATVPISVAAHTACAGGVQRVLFDEHGAIIGLSTSGRIFTPQQRKAILTRDRECLIPGCHVRSEWCETHHVQEWARGGPTHTSNGVALCWHHHRTLDTSGWQIRMQHGMPEIRGPAWWDPHRRWRRPHNGYRAVDRVLAGARGG